MGRKRVIDQGKVLDAAEAVVARDGAARLTLDAVAEQAGISKASVLYDYDSKQALVEAVVQRAVRNDNAFHDAVTESLGTVTSTVIRGRIVAASTPPPDDARAVALNLCAALAQDSQLRRAIQTNQAAVIDKILETSESPRGALLAYLALEGLKLLEYLDFHRWPEEERARILRELNWLVDAHPQQAKALPEPVSKERSPPRASKRPRKT
ncbi:TetR/AcrR family transcriptional regulator [Archangium lansingense]|uniref:TetR/AcrR family transcriptional regulator n=1 Tax=Archangium lansingense TaxID=2995310 RepID=A0ABT3ZUG6_9BACT|nr:TetR/AcrR family transcriptional regulator [Archangium lansinium]MCY1073030.1 TetR/AcrR family transcriptional regulator [Archangium lansinium]